MRPAIASGIVTEDMLVNHWPIFSLFQNCPQKFSRLSFPLDSKFSRFCRCFSGFASVGVYGGSDCLQAINLPSTVSQSINSCTRTADRQHHGRIC